MAPSAFTVRDVEPADFDRWLPMWEAYNAFYGLTGPTAMPLGMTRHTWARFFDPAVPMHGLVAERRTDGALLGLVNYLFHPSTWSPAPYCYLEDLFTDAPSRGQGVGRALIEAVCRRAREAGSPRLYWHTETDNRVARRLYDSVAGEAGFVVYRLRP